MGHVLTEPRIIVSYTPKKPQEHRNIADSVTVARQDAEASNPDRNAQPHNRCGCGYFP